MSSFLSQHNLSRALDKSFSLLVTYSSVSSWPRHLGPAQSCLPTAQTPVG